MAAIREYAPEETGLSYERKRATDAFERYIQDCAAWSRGEDLPDGWTPCSTFWLVNGDDYLGSVHVRHSITERMHSFGGHIGYIIRPSQRRKGYGLLSCRLALDAARELGLHRVLLTCADTNVASATIIERSGGVLQDKVMVGTRPFPTRRYWIGLTVSDRLRSTSSTDPTFAE